MYNQRIPRKMVIGALVGVLSIVALIFCFTNTLVVLDNVGEEKTVSIVGNKGAEKQIVLSEEQKGKWLILPRDKYSIGATSPYRYSQYSKNLNGFYKKISIKSSPQLASKFAGNSSFGCLVGSSPVFSPCRNYRGSIEVSSGDTIKPLVLDEVFDHDHEEAETHDEPEQPPSSAAKAFGQDLLALVSKENKLSMKLFSTREQKTVKEGVLLDGFSGGIKDSFFSVFENKSFVIFNSANKSISIFDGLEASPKKIDLGKELELFDEDHDVLLALSENKIFVVLTKNLDLLDEHSLKGEHRDTFDFAGKLIVIDKNNEYSIKEHSLPKSFIPRVTEVASSDRLILGPQYSGDSHVYEFFDGKFSKTDLPNNLLSFCFSEGQLYYNNESNQIFTYSFEDGGGSLVYESLWGEIIDINCSGGRVGFGIISDISPVSEALGTPRYFLVPSEHKGPRIDGVLPFYLTFNTDTYFVEQSKLGVSVRLEYDSSGNGPSEKETVKKQILDEVKKKTRVLSDPVIELRF